MSRKQKARIKDLERTLRASVARNAIVARENRELWAAYEAVGVERDEWQRVADEVAENNEELQSDLGECQAGREANQKEIFRLNKNMATLFVPLSSAYELRAENAELKSKIKAITTAVVDWAEHGSALIAELSDGDEG